MKIIFLMLYLLLVLISCNAQTQFPTDWEIYNLKGNPKKMTTETWMFSKLEERKVYFYDESGYVTKMEQYNPNTPLSTKRTITYYKYPEDGLKTSVTFYEEDGDTVKTETYRHVIEQTIKITSRNYKNSTYREKEYNLDSKKRIVKNETKSVRTGKDTLFPDVYTKFIYTDDEIERVVIVDEADSSESEMFSANKKFDEKGNFTYSEYVDEDESVLFEMKREFEYY